MGTVTISGPSPTSTKVPPERVAWRTNTQTRYVLQSPQQAVETRSCILQLQRTAQGRAERPGERQGDVRSP